MRFIDTERDPWPAAAGPDGEPPPRTGTQHRLLTFEQWQAMRGEPPEAAPIGVIAGNDEDIEVLRPDLERLALVVLQFPKWTDGRAYSQARVLRGRLRFGGEIRAVGDVVVDMLPLLRRTGFDAVQLRADQPLDSAERALRFFDSYYQGDAVEPRARFSRAHAFSH